MLTPAFEPKPPPTCGRDHAQLAVADVQRLGDQVALGKGRLAGGPEGDLRVDVLLRHADVRLHRHMLDVRHAIFMLVDEIRLGPALRHVSFAHLEPVGDVGARLRQDERLAGVVAQLRMQKRRFGAGAELRIEDARQRLVLDVDQLQRVRRDLRRVGRHGRHRLAHETHAIQREDAAVAEVEAGIARKVLAGDDHAHARQRLRSAHVDPFDQSVRDRAAFQRAVEQVRAELHVVDVGRRACHLLAPLDALRAGADEGRTTGSWDGRRSGRPPSS